MVNIKADTTYVKEIKEELDKKIHENKILGLENSNKIKKLWAWTEKLTEVLAKIETIVKINYPLAL